MKHFKKKIEGILVLFYQETIFSPFTFHDLLAGVAEGVGPGRAKALSLFCLGKIFQGPRINVIVCKCMINEATVNSNASLSWQTFYTYHFEIVSVVPDKVR